MRLALPIERERYFSGTAGQAVVLKLSTRTSTSTKDLSSTTCIKIIFYIHAVVAVRQK